jgi:hypothetical protein
MDKSKAQLETKLSQEELLARSSAESSESKTTKRPKALQSVLPWGPWLETQSETQISKCGLKSKPIVKLLIGSKWLNNKLSNKHFNDQLRFRMWLK